MAESTGFENGVWAVVTAKSGAKYLGDVTGMRLVSDGTLIPRHVTLRDAYEVSTQNIPVPTPQGVAMTRQCAVYPVDNCLHPVRLEVYRPSELVYVNDLHRDDKRRYEQMLEECRAQILRTRAQESGIAVASQKGGPGIVKPGH